MSNATDAQILAKAILDDWKGYDDGDSAPNDRYCKFCNESSWGGYEAIVHDLDCPVLVAKDVRTGIAIVEGE